MIRIELEKVTFHDGSAITAIDTAGYILEWVYRTNDASKDYYVLPVPEVEAHPDSFIHDNDSREAFKTFVADSRSLLKKHNVGIGEFSSPVRFHVEFNATDTLGVRKYLEENSSVSRINNVNYPTIQVGPFTWEDAVHLKRRIELNLPVENIGIRSE